MLQMYMEMNPSHMCVKLDVTNAYPTMSRAAMLEVLKTEPELRHMTWSFVTSMAAPTGLESAGQKWGDTGDGLLQGKPSSSGYFCCRLAVRGKEDGHRGEH